MANDPQGVTVFWNGGMITFSSDESRESINEAMAALEGHAISWSMDRPAGNVIELAGPALIDLDSDESISFMVLKTPASVKAVKWILWLGPANEAEGFIANTRKRSWIDGYKLIQRPYRFTGNPEDN